MTFNDYKAIPEAMRNACKYTGVITIGTGSAPIRFDCEAYNASSGFCSITLFGVIFDSSQRVEGIVLQPEWSFLEEWTWGGNIAWNVRPIRTEEK